MAEGTFERSVYARALHTQRLGHALFTRSEVESTNDEAWDLAQRGADEGACVVADAQTRGRGRAGRVWHTAPGKGLALSVLLHPGCDRGAATTAPLVAGLALVRGLEALGLEARLKWPNDVLVGPRKLAGILAESRCSAEGTDIVVMGVGVNVTQNESDFPPELRSKATSMALAGRAARREVVAAAFLNALEPLWDEHQEGDRGQVIEAWRARTSIWGRPVRVATTGGEVRGVADDIDPSGGLVVRTASGASVTVLSGDVVVEWPEGAA